jgi:hypothetical protein
LLSLRGGDGLVAYTTVADELIVSHAALGVTDRNTPVSQLIARKLIELAQAGERDPDSLKELTIDAVQTSVQ